MGAWGQRISWKELKSLCIFENSSVFICFVFVFRIIETVYTNSFQCNKRPECSTINHNIRARCYSYDWVSRLRSLDEVHDDRNVTTLVEPIQNTACICYNNVTLYEITRWWIGEAALFKLHLVPFLSYVSYFFFTMIDLRSRCIYWLFHIENILILKNWTSFHFFVFHIEKSF